MVLSEVEKQCGISREKGVEHSSVVGMENFSIRFCDVHHGLNRLGDVPCAFEHVQQTFHAARACERHVEGAALAVVLPRIADGDALLQ